MSLLALQLLQAFNLQEIAHQVFLIQNEEKERKRLAAERLTLSYVMSPQGFALAELFGYYLSQQLKEDLIEIGRRKQRIRLSYDQYVAMMNELWVNMKQYKLFLPILFTVLKEYNTVSLRDLQKYLEICKAEINPFMARLKQLIPPLKIRELASSIESACEREDLKNQGLVDKLIIVDLIKKFLTDPKHIIEIDERLIVNDEVNYRLLLSPSYLRSGEAIRQFLEGRLANKIKKLVKRAAMKKKGGRKKKQGKRMDRTSAKKKQTKEEKIIRQFMQENKKEVKEDRKKLELIIKSLVYECIQQAAEISALQTEEKPETKLRKSIYTGEPVIVERQLKLLPGQAVQVFPILHDSAMFISQGQGRIISLLDGSIKSSFNLNPSQLLKKSPICDYTYFNNVLFVLREDGLLFSWNNQTYSYSKLVQTKYRYIHKPIEEFNTKKAMFVHQGILVLNCQETNNSLELYSLGLEFVGNVPIKKEEYGLSHVIVKEARELAHILKNIKRDYVVRSQFQYEGLIRANYQYKEYELGNYLFSKAEAVSALKVGDHVDWICSYKTNNPLYFDKAMMQRLKIKKTGKADYAYLLNYHYIKEATPTEVESFIRSHCIVEVDKQRRKSFLVTLFQDNALKEVGERQYMSRQELLGWIEKCSLSQQEQSQLFCNLTYNCQGKVCLYELVHSQQYLKILSLRQNRFYPNQYYETNELPPIILDQIVPFPLLEFFISTTRFPNFNYLYIFSFRNLLIRKINLNDYLEGEVARDGPVLTYCQESGYLAVCYNNFITVWSINKITEKESLPIKKIKGLEKDAIIDMQFMYFSNTFATLTKTYIKFWDLDEILFKNEANSIVFKIKPGFKAIERQSEVSKWQAKKKIMIRGKGKSCFNAVTKASNYIVGVVSGGLRTTEAFLKIFYVCKFHIMIGSSRQYDQVPTKILRQLDSEAKRMKYMEKVIDRVSYNEEQEKRVDRMIAELRERLGAKRESNSKELSIALINKVSNLHTMLTNYSRIVNPSLLKAELQIDEAKVFKFNLMLKIYLSQSSEELSLVFSPDFVQLYKERGQLSKEAIMQDIFQWQDRTYLSKFLCLMSQICKYSLPYKCNYIQLIYNQKQDKLDANLIETLLANSQISKSIIHLVVALANQLKIDSVKSITTKVIDKFLPTQYRYPSLRYYKSIYSHTIDTPFSYFINRFDNYSHIDPKEVILSPKGYKDIFQHIEKENILESVQELSKLYPQIVKDNLQLIDLCMSYSLITEQQATFYFLAPTNTSLLNLLSNNQPKRSIVDFDNVISLIVYALNQQKVRIPSPYFTYQWFSDRFKAVIGKDDKVYDIFYNQLRGSITQHVAYSRELQFYIQLNKKNIRINYNPINWKYLIGTRIYPLTYHIQTIKQRFYKQKIIDAYSFQKYLAELAPKEAQTITVRACAASKNHDSYIKNFKQERNIKDYQEDYINVEHFMLFLEESKRQKEAQTVATNQLQTVPLFDLKIPTFCLINQLSKCTSFLTRQQLIQIASESVSSFTYGSMLDWIKSLPFARMRGKEGKESRMCAIWELKKYLKPEWEMFGWMLLNKYGKANVLNKCIIVQGTIDAKQLSQVFFSEAVFKLFVSCFPELKNYENTYPLEILERIVDKELVNPALQCIYHVFKHQIGRHLPLISEVLNALANKTEEMDMQKFVKYFLTSSDTKEANIKLIFNNIIGRTKRIKIKESLAKIVSFAKNTQQADRLANWLAAHEEDDKSLLEKIIPIIEPHRITNKRQASPENLIITIQHFEHMTRQQSWTYSYQPFFTLPQFFDHIHETASPSEHLSSLINNCILKHGIHSIFNSIQQGQFAQFYAKCRSVSKSLAKLTVVQFCKLYQLLSQEGKGLSLLRIFKASQLEIMPEERISWIIEYSSQVDKETLNIQTLKVSNLVLNTQQSSSDLQQLVSSLKYKEYLVKRYIKSANKLALILKELQDTITLYKTLSQLHLSHDQISLLSKYLKTQGEEMLSRLRQSQNKATVELSQSQEKILLEEIANYIAYFQSQSKLTKNNPQFNVNNAINDVMITETSLFKKMNEENSPEWSCLPTYINLYHYCQNLLVNNLFRKHAYRQMVLDELNKCMLATSLTLKNLYDLFGLAYYDNFMKYLTFFISPNPKHHAISSKVFKMLRKYIFQSFIRYDWVNEIKYPLNFGSFKQLMGQVDIKSQQRQINYGELYKRYNIWGCGYVNLNDIPSQRTKRLSHPYIEINSYLSEAFPSIKGWRKINPPVQVFENREKICNQLIKLEEQSHMKSKLIGESNLWRILGFYLTKQHRMYIQHEFQAKGARQYYNIVDIIQWINSQDDNEALTADVLAKTVAKIEDEGGIYSVLRKYHKQVILAQESDSYKQQNAYLLHLLEQSGGLQTNSLKEYVKQLLVNHNIEQYVDKQHQMENSEWLEQSLRLIVDTFNKEVRQWTNYNNNLVKFLNELPQNQFSLIRQLYQSNYQYTCHKLFDILANGSLYFTFTTFWVYNTSSDDAYPYSKEEVHEVYKIIDVNSDGNISYQQFCRFWSAVQQIYVHPTPPIINKIANIKLSILQAFLDSIQGSFEKEVSSQSSFITLQMLEVLTNIKHKQKLQRMIKIISPQDKFGQFIDLHKLKVLLKQHNAKKNRERHATIKHSNYFAKTLGTDIQEYINNKDNLQNTLSRWLVFTYPNFGHYLAQCFFELYWDKNMIGQWISDHQSKIENQGKMIETIKKIEKGSKISPQNEGLYQKLMTLPKKFELFYKKFLRKHYEPKQYGKSISYKMCLNKIQEEYATTIQEMNHISYFLEDVDFSQNRLIYKFQENQRDHYDPEDTSSSFAAYKAAVFKGEFPFSKYSQRIIIKQNISCLQSALDYFYKREYEIINKQLRCKSNNRLSLLANKTLYSDCKISISFYDEERSNSNKFVLYSDFSRFRPLPEVEIKKDSKFASLESMIKLIDMAAYIQKNYQLIGLFVNMHNICIDFNSEKQFRLAQFIGGIKLDSQGNYFEGINPEDINSDDHCIYPPQIFQNVFTETFDSYCLAHILYYFFTGELVENKEIVPSAEESVWFNYSQLHYIAQKQISFLSLLDKNIDIESQIVFFTLLYDCTSFQWHLRPQLHQIASTLRNIGQLHSNLEDIGNEQLIVKAKISQICQRHLQANNIEMFTSSVESSKQYEWTMEEIERIRFALPEDPRYYSIYNDLLQQMLQRLEDVSQVGQMEDFMVSAVEYLCQSTKKQTAFMALQAFKNIITSSTVKRYLDYCDQKWKINEFNIHEKLKQLNTENRIIKLPKSSQYYLDLSTLIDSKITLFMTETSETKSKKDSTKKIAICFIESSLSSHNVNKICALQKSGVMLNLYRYIEQPEFQQAILKIYCLATDCLNSQESIVTHRAIEEGYKVMMVMHNIINLQKGSKGGETVVDMLTYMNNYYNFYGEECKAYVLKRLCETQICNFATFTFLFNSKINSKDYLYKMLLNLTQQEKYWKMLKGVTVQAYDSCIKEIKKSSKYQQVMDKLQQLLRTHEARITLNELSNESLDLQNKQFYTSKDTISSLYSSYELLIERHILFFSKRPEKLTEGSQYRYQNNFYEHYQQFLKEIRRLVKAQLENTYFSAQSCNFIKNGLYLHYRLIELWSVQEETIEYMMQFTEKMYEKECLYTQNKLLNEIQGTVFGIITALAAKSQGLLVKLGFIHFLMRVMKKQHHLLEHYVSKGVQNMQLKNIYSQQAEFRLNTIDKLLQSNNEEIHRIFVGIGFAKYLVQVMLSSQLVLDLRYYKANFDIVPFRFCSPLRSQAITILSFILPIRQSILRSEVVSRLISVIAVEKDKLTAPVDSPENKMKFVEVLWLFGNIVACDDQRLKYEFVNNGGYNILSKLIEKYEYLSIFFPKMSETIRTGSLLKSSMVFSRVLNS